MAEQPLLLRLKELDSLKEMAAKVQEVRLVDGANRQCHDRARALGILRGDARPRSQDGGVVMEGPGPVTGRAPIHYLGAQAPSKLPFEP